MGRRLASYRIVSRWRMSHFLTPTSKINAPRRCLMFLASWLRTLKGLRGPSTKANRQAGGRRGFIPQVMALEDRTLPSTFTVFNLNDSGFGSLRQAVFLANVFPGADTINFAPWLSGTIKLTSGQLNIIDDV